MPLEWIGIGIFVALVALICIGLPVFLAMFLLALVGFWLMGGPDFLVAQVTTATYAIADNYMFAVIPLFILMGEIASRSGIAEDAFGAANKWIGRLRGGQLMATIVANGFFGAASGSPMSGTVLSIKMALPELIKQRYDKRFCLAAIVSAGCLVALIPPSTPALFFCILTGVSIGRALVAGIIPGILLTLILCLGVWIQGKKNPQKVPVRDFKVTWRERFSSLSRLWPLLVLFVLIIGGIYLGVFPPTVGGAIGSVATLVYALVRRVDKRIIFEAFRETALMNCQIFAIIIAGFMFGRATALSGLADYLTQVVVDLQVPPLAVMGIVVLVYILISFPLEFMPAMVITLPVFFPLLTNLGFSPWTLCVVLTVLNTIAILTPPTGVIVYVAATLSGENVWDLWREVLPWFLVLFAFVCILILFPPLSNWLPNLMYG